jgi:hypothetical protein
VVEKIADFMKEPFGGWKWSCRFPFLSCWQLNGFDHVSRYSNQQPSSGSPVWDEVTNVPSLHELQMVRFPCSSHSAWRIA